MNFIREGRRGPRLSGRAVRGRTACCPMLCDAEQRLAGWLADLEPEQSAAIRQLAAQFPQRRHHPSRVSRKRSPYLFDLMRADAARPVRLLGCDPDRHLAELIDNDLPRSIGRHQRSRCDAVAASHEIGSRSSDRAVRHRRRLAGDAGDIGADRACGQSPCKRRCAICCARDRARADVAARPGQAGGEQRPDRAGDGQDGRWRAELLQRHRPDRLFRFQRADIGAGHRAAAVLRARSRKVCRGFCSNAPATAMCSASICGCGRIRPRRRSRFRPRRRCIITSGKGGPGSAPP